MSSEGVADYEQVLHLQQIDIESPIAANIRLELQIDETPVNIRNGDNACWKSNHSVEITSTADIALTVTTRHRLLRKEKVIRVTGSDVWNSSSGFNLSISRSITLTKQPVKATFEFRLPTTPGSDAAFAALQNALNEAKGYRSLIGSSKLQQSFDTALKIGIALSEMDPFTKAAFALARTTFDLLKEQQRYDDLVLKLADSFERILPFATIVALDSEMSKTLQVIVEDLFDIVEKGAQFICQFVRRTSTNRLLVSLFSSEDREFIDRLQERLAKIIDDFDRAIAVDTLNTVNQTGKVVHETQELVRETREAVEDTREDVHDVGDRSLLKEVLKPVYEATYNLHRGCFEGTRQDILPKIFGWASDPSSPEKILWLYGIPGSGKTAVANSLCDMLHTSKSLAASFFCRRDDPLLSKPESLFPTLVYDLASTWGPYRKLVVSALRDDPKLQPKLTKRFFDELIAKPLGTLDQHPDRPLIVVIDALDEYGDIGNREDLLSSMVTATSTEAFTELGPNSYFGLDLDVAHDTQADMRLFAEKRLAPLGKRRHLRNWPNKELLDHIMERSGGLFISIQTIWLFIKESSDPDRLLHQVLEGIDGKGAHDHLYDLYKTILNVKVGLESQEVKAFRLIIGSVIAVAARRSLCDDTLAALLEMKPPIVKSMVDNVESLFYREGEDKVIRVRHLSIIDFLSGPSCPRQYRVDFQQVHAKLTTGCFKIMSKELRFNICDLQTSFLLNDKVTDMDERVNRLISDRLLYSSIQWARHLESTNESLRVEKANIEQAIQAYQMQVAFPAKCLENESCEGQQAEDRTQVNRQTEPLQELRAERGNKSITISGEVDRLNTFEEKEKASRDEMLNYIQHFTRNQFLFWLEALSVIKQVGLASRMLSALIHWIHINNQDDAIAIDMLKFVEAFAVVISQCPAHLSIGATLCAADIPHITALHKPLSLNTSRADRSLVTSVAFSHDGKHIVSGSYDNTVRVWNAETGEVVGKPFEGHTGSVSSVAFSHDGKHIVSGSYDNTVHIWDAESGNTVGEPFEGHTGRLTSVAFEHDGKHIVSGSYDNGVRVWNAETGEVVGKPFEGHTGPVSSVAFSHGGKIIVSGSQDYTVNAWDAEKGKPINSPRFTHYSKMVGGWVVDSNSQLLFWAPPQLRPGLSIPGVKSIIGRFVKTTLDLTSFAHAESWTLCGDTANEGEVNLDPKC